MSNRQREKAKIPGLKGPFFPKRLEVVQPLYSLWAARNYNALRLAAAVAILHPRAPVSDRFSFALRREPYHQKTSDKYGWRALDFKIARRGFHHGMLTILLPQCNDRKLKDGTFTDRSIALYTTNAVGDDCLDQFVRLFNDALESIAEPIAA